MSVAEETKVITLVSKYGITNGTITVTINNDAANEKVSVTAVMNGKANSGNYEGDWASYLYIMIDGATVASNSQPKRPQYFWDSTYSCSWSGSYKDSCTITVGGYFMCQGGAFTGEALEGFASYTVEAYKPPTPITVNTTTIQMGRQLLITLNRAYGDYTHTLYYKFGTGSETAIASNVGTSYAWTVPDLAAFCNNAVSGSCTLRAITYRGNTYIGETTATITLTVQDPTTPSVSGNEVTMGAASYIACGRQSSNFTIRLSLDFQGTTAGIQEGQIDSCYWTPGYELAKQIPTMTYATGTLICVTLNGAAVVGTRTITIRVNVPDNEATRPSITGVSLEPISSLSGTFAGLYIRGKTGLKVTIAAGSAYSAVSHYEVWAGGAGASGNPASISLLVNDGNITVTVRVTDARGYFTTVTQNIYVYPYSRPKVVPYTGYSEVICERALSSGALSAKGTYLAIKAGKRFTTISPSGTNLNPCLLRYRYKLSTTGSYGEWVTLLENGSAATEISNLISDVVSSLSSSYDVELQAVDALGESHTLHFAIMTKAISFKLYDGEDGAGFGKEPEEPHVVDIASHMTLRVRGKFVVDSEGWSSLGLAGGINESVYPVGRYEASGCHYHVSNGNHVYVAFNCAFVYPGYAIRINNNPIPQVYRPSRDMFMLCPMNGNCIALVCVRTDGCVYVDWVISMASGAVATGAEVVWIDGYTDYWI